MIVFSKTHSAAESWCGDPVVMESDDWPRWKGPQQPHSSSDRGRPCQYCLCCSWGVPCDAVLMGTPHSATTKWEGW